GAVLCLLVLGTIAAGRRGDRAAPIVLAAVVPVAASIAFAIGLASHAVDSSKPDGPIGSADGPLSYLSFQSGTDSTALMSTLFWNPQIRRVIDLCGKSVDGFASIPAPLAPGG